MAFFGRARVRRKAPNACALITARVLEMGADMDGEGDRDEREVLEWPVLRRLRLEVPTPSSPSLGPKGAAVKRPFTMANRPLTPFFQYSSRLGRHVLLVSRQVAPTATEH